MARRSGSPSDAAALGDAPTTVIPTVVIDAPTAAVRPVGAPRVCGRDRLRALVPWVGFGVVAVAVVAATTAWSATLRGPEEISPAYAPPSRVLGAQPGPAPTAVPTPTAAPVRAPASTPRVSRGPARTVTPAAPAGPPPDAVAVAPPAVITTTPPPPVARRSPCYVLGSATRPECNRQQSTTAPPTTTPAAPR